MKNSLQSFKQLWTTTDFDLADITSYAENHLINETRAALMSMSMLLMVLVLAAMGVNIELDLGSAYFNTYLLVVVLSGHIFFSARSMSDLKTLNMLGITLLVLSATAFVSIAHQTGEFTPLLFSNVVLLFMLVPLIPWGLREASIVVLLIYLMITLSIGWRANDFDADTVWNLQFFMLGTGLISIALVAFNVSVRRDDMKTRFDLEKAHDRMYRLSNIDPLTGIWNRRFLPIALTLLRERFATGRLHFMIFDLDAFKILNDSHGHDYGDKILLLISNCFGSHLADNGFLIRFGGDEFVLLIVSEELETLLEQVNIDIRHQLNKEDKIKNSGFGVSFGRVETSLDGPVNLERLYKDADDILYHIKRKRYNQDNEIGENKSIDNVDYPLGQGSNWRLET
ncbi:MAG: GGDEF domain-containing protein [Pseudomonadota bacterium]|nr:GGDEF domain-containing protein [Pseudomonadota bacterium]MDO7710406.1 GGDEF domain-containing protein [Pseudomonadota bacterium]